MALELFATAESLAESAGAMDSANGFCIDQGFTYADRGDPTTALKHFGRALGRLEASYLAFTDTRQAERHAERYSNTYDRAVSCALEIDRPDIALAISDRSKALRLTRGFDDGEDTDGNELSAARKFVIWRRVLQRQQLAPEERAALEDRGQRRTEPDGKWVYAEYLQQIFRHILPNSPIQGGLAELDTFVEPSPPYAGGFRCDACWVFNKVESSYCSACENLLPKSAVMPAVDSMRCSADILYNRGLSLLKSGDIDKAQGFFTEAYRSFEHPDFIFFAGYCCLQLGDTDGALVNFNFATAHQFAALLPFWPLPVKPSDMDDCLVMLRAESCETRLLIARINEAMHAYFPARSDS
jgi:tetratricopeptide (TPR) repeat protein